MRLSVAGCIGCTKSKKEGALSQKVSQERLNSVHGLATTHPEQAVPQVRALLAEFPRDVNLTYNASSIFIDAGSILGNSALVREGISQLEALYPHAAIASRSHLAYNIGNGCMALHEIRSRQASSLFNPQDSCLGQAKKWYREA